MYVGDAKGVYISLAKFQLDICGRKGLSSQWIFLFFLVGPIAWLIFLGQYVVPWT